MAIKPKMRSMAILHGGSPCHRPDLGTA